MLNHSPNPNIGWKDNAGAIELYALRHIDSGKELTLTYGSSANGNKDTLKTYGFTTSEPDLNKNDKIEFTRSEVVDAFHVLLTSSGTDVSHEFLFNAIQSLGHGKAATDGKASEPDFLDQECRSHTRYIRHFVRQLVGVKTENESKWR